MKKLIVFLLILIILSGCSSNEVNRQTDDSVSNDSISDSIQFADPIFERYFRISIGKLEGDITKDEVEAIKQLRLTDGNYYFSYKPYEMVVEPYEVETESGSSYVSYSIENKSTFDVVHKLKDENNNVLRPSSTEDLKLFIGLEYLEIDSLLSGEWTIRNLEFLKSIPNLKYLKIEQWLWDLTPLKNSTKLEYLGLDFSEVTDFSVFSEMDSVKYIRVLDQYTETENKIREYLKLDNVNFIY